MRINGEDMKLTEYLKNIFMKNGKKKELPIDKFIIDIEQKVDTLNLSDKAISRIEKRIKEFNTSIKNVLHELQGFSEERREMEQISSRMMELISLVYTMDLKINEINRKYEQLKREISITATSKSKKSVCKSKNGRQVEFSLDISSRKEKQ